MIWMGVTYPVIGLYNKTSSSFTDVILTSSTPLWSTNFKKIKKNVDKSRGIINYSDEKPTNITITFTDDKGHRHSFVAFENYIIKGKPTLRVIFHDSPDEDTFIFETTSDYN